MAGFLFVCFRWKAEAWRHLGNDDIRETEFFVGYIPWHVKPGDLISGKTLYFRAHNVVQTPCP